MNFPYQTAASILSFPILLLLYFFDYNIIITIDLFSLSILKKSILFVYRVPDLLLHRTMNKTNQMYFISCKIIHNV